VSGRGFEPDEARALIREQLGLEPVAVERMPYGHFNVTYDVALPDGRRVIVRTNRDPRPMRGARHNLPLLRNLGLPVPRLLAAGEHWLILEKIPGRDLGHELDGMSREQMTRLAEQVVSFERRAAALPPAEGYGWRPIGEPGRYPSWGALIDHDLEKNLARTRDLLPEGLEARFLRRAHELGADFASVPPTPFLDDLTTKNVIVERGELRGIVDFDVICYGDPRYWLGLTRTAVLSTNRPEAAFYVDELLRLWGATERDRGVVGYYSAIFGLDFIAYGRSRALPTETLRFLLDLAAEF
jgi:aminoglycoside phosphotransferase (APT) family kinase protein